IRMARLTQACPINPRQRGFIRAAGCSENLKLLQLVVKHAKKKHREFGIVFVDIAKASDTICHQHIIMGLIQRGVIPPLYFSLVKCMKTLLCAQT
ncbi:POLR protein, partial [Melanocharis versteri]|nr:POLR protein [Melanocharis versteri]